MSSPKIFVPPGATPTVGQPRNPIVVMDTPEGKIYFPQVALAIISPDVLDVIAEAVYRKFHPPSEEVLAQEATAKAIADLENEGGAVKAG